jgi:molybdate transport system substrate-binding protein
MPAFPGARRALAALSLCLLTTPLGAVQSADELTVMSSGGYTAALQRLAPDFERSSGHHLQLVLGPSMGTSPDAIPNRLARGEEADLLIMVGSALDGLIAAGRVRADSRADVADSKIGLAVRAGQAKPDISTIDGLRQVLLSAHSIAYSDSASGVYVETELYKKLGLEAPLKPKSRMIVAERIGAVVARGDAEVGFQQVSELLPIPGIVFAGPIPDAVQKVTTFAAGIPTAARHPDRARELLAYLATAAARSIVIDAGLTPKR